MSVSAAKFVIERPWLLRALTPVAQWYGNAQGYRQLGLKADDLWEEENEIAQLALKRLSEKQHYDRIYRIRRAVQCSYQNKLLPKSEWTKPEDDMPYLEPIINDIRAEMAERKALDSLEVTKSH
ncbi:hypothetical protein BROUX41_000481 [Berkeleyomyces rouxiae]|uniref:uncharacterized protein n=1 Tax=Berkeleyomyces rouxiae TaxID=2035830 RepID=UPI003B76AA53